MPEEFIADDGMCYDKFIKYAKPLILVKVTQIIELYSDYVYFPLNEK